MKRRIRYIALIYFALSQGALAMDTWNINCDPSEQACSTKPTQVVWEKCERPPRWLAHTGKCDAIKASKVWQRYINPRYGVSVDIPPGFESPFGPQNGDGRTFKHPDGSELLVFGGHNLGNRKNDYFSAEDVLTSQISYLSASGINITEKALGKNWISLAGEDNENFYFIKKSIDKNLIKTAQFKYSKSSSINYTNIVKRFLYSLNK